jgi:hypothetical protein
MCEELRVKAGEMLGAQAKTERQASNPSGGVFVELAFGLSCAWIQWKGDGGGGGEKREDVCGSSEEDPTARLNSWTRLAMMTRVDLTFARQMLQSKQLLRKIFFFSALDC